MRYRKDDVDFHAEYMQDGHAAVNVKDRGDDVPLGDVLDDFGYILATGVDADDLAEAIASDQYIWEAAAETGWELADAEAEEHFGAGYGVASEGRSGGWCVVTYNGRPTFDQDDVAGWDAVALSRWHAFERDVRAIADDQGYRMAWIYIANVLEPARADVASFELAGVGL